MTGQVEVRLAGQLLGLAVSEVRDVVRMGAVTPVPRAPACVAGVMNLRGRIATAIDLRLRLGLPPRQAGGPAMGVVVEADGHPYALVVDAVGDVVAADGELAPCPVTLAPVWRAVAQGVVKSTELMIVLDVAALLTLPDEALAA